MPKSDDRNQVRINRFNKQKALFLKWKHEGDEDALEELYDTLEPLINNQVAVFKGSNIPEHALKEHAYTLVADALKNYDPNKASLGTHVSNYLRKMYRYASKYQNVARIPEHKVQLIPKYKNFVDEYKEKHDKYPDIETVAKGLKVRKSEIEDLRKMLRNDTQLREDANSPMSRKLYHGEMTVRDVIEYMRHTLKGNERKIYDMILEGKTVGQIADELGMKYHDVYRIKTDIGKRMKKELSQI